MQRVTCREFHLRGLLAVGIAVAIATLVVLARVTDGSASGLLNVAALFLIFPTLFLASVYWMSRIVRTSDRLRASNESFHFPKDHGLRIAGGSLGRRIGIAMLVLRGSDSTNIVAVFTRGTDVLDPLLTEWTESVNRSCSQPRPACRASRTASYRFAAPNFM